jgi:hypothetical protein
MATNKQPQGNNAAELDTVAKLGDVTESNAPQIVMGDMIEISPMSALPKGYESLAKSYPTAKGFTVEGSSVAVHF